MFTKDYMLLLYSEKKKKMESDSMYDLESLISYMLRKMVSVMDGALIAGNELNQSIY